MTISTSEGFSFDYHIINPINATETVINSPFGELGEQLIAIHPDNQRFLTLAYNFDSDTDSNQIVLIDSTTDEGHILVEYAGYSIDGIEWNPEGTQFLYWRHPASEFGFEGDIWIYDMESDEARPLNQIGSFVGWLN